MVKTGKRIFSWHHWCGLIVGVFLLIMSISGAILVFSDEIEATYESPWKEVASPAGGLGYDASFETVRSHHQGWEIRIYGQPAPGEAIVYDLRKGAAMKKVFAHPATGTIIHETENVQRQLHRQLLTLHYTLFSGTPGKIIVFVIGILFFITLVTGMYLYRKAILKVLSFKVHINRKTDRSFYSSLHRVVGVWALIFNLLIVVTGLFISGNIIFTALKKTPVKKPEINAAPVSVDKLKARLRREHPDFTVHLVRVAAGSNTVQFSGAFTDDPFYYGKYYSRFFFDGTSGELQKKEWMRNLGAFKRWQSMTGPLHFGNYGGLPVKILYCVFGLMPGVLSISGFLIWRSRKPKEKKRR